MRCNGNGNRYSAEEKKKVLLHLARHGISDEIFYTSLGLSCNLDRTTIHRQIVNFCGNNQFQTWLEEARENSSFDFEGITQWVERVKGTVETACLSFAAYYKCFHKSLLFPNEK